MLKIFKNTFFGFITQLLLLISSLIISIAIGRNQGPELLGQFSFVISFVNLFSFLPDLGINLYLIREISRKKESVQEYINNALGALIIIAPFAYGILIGTSRLIEIPELYQTSIYVGGIYLILGAFTGLFRASFYAFEKMEYETITILSERLITLFGCIGVLMLHGGLFEIIVVHAIARFVTLLMGIFIFTRRISKQPQINFDLIYWIRTISNCLPFALNTMTSSIYIQADLVLVTLWIGDSDAGIYKAATGLIIPMAIIAASLNSALFPEMARSHEFSKERMNKLIDFSVKYLFIIGWPLSLGIGLLASKIIFILYGNEFSAAAIPLSILALIIPLRFMNNSLGTSLTAINRQTYRAIIIFGSALFNLLLNIYLIHKWSYIGASISTLLTEVVITIFLYSGIKNYNNKFNVLKLIYKILFSGVVMALVVFINKELNVILIIFIAMIIYILSLYVFREFRFKEMIEILKKGMNKY